MAETIIYEKTGNIVTMTMNRPDSLNAINRQLRGELQDALVEFDNDPEAFVAIITGAGRAFCSGRDLKERAEDNAQGIQADASASMTKESPFMWPRTWKPLIAAVNGFALAGGWSIARMCDLRIASDKAKIAFLFTKVGLSGADMGIAWLLPRIVGFGRATELLMTGDFIDAQRAYEIGLYNRVVSTEAVLGEARTFAEQLAKAPSYALGVTKQSLNQEASLDLESALQAEAEAQAVCMEDPNFREAFEAFQAKRGTKFA